MAGELSDDEIMHEAEALAAGESEEKARLEKACEETTNDIEELRKQLEKLKATRTTEQLAYDASLIAIALTDSESFLAKMLNTSKKQLDELQAQFGGMMERSVDHFVRQMDAMHLRSYFVPTEGNTHPNLSFSVSEDRKVFRLQRWTGLKDEKKQLDWELNFGPRAALEDIGFRRVTAANSWIANVTDWAKVIGDAPNAPMPPFPMVPNPLEEIPEKDATKLTTDVPPKSERKSPAEPVKKPGIEADPRVPALLKLIKGKQIPSAESRLPEPGSAFFDYTDSYLSRTRTVLRPDMFVGKRTVLVLGTSYMAHWRIAKEGFGCFVDLGGAEPQELKYPWYDMTHLPTDDPNTVILQVAGSGWHVKYGPYPRNAAAMYKLVTEEIFDFQDGFRPDYLMLQMGTNDLKFCTTRSVPVHLMPKTDLQFVEEMKEQALEFADAFKPRISTVLLGMGSPKYRLRPDQLNVDQPLGPETRPDSLHKVLHRVTYLYEGVAAQDAKRARNNFKLKLVHSPMPLLPPEAAVRINHHIGHIQASWYAICARNAVNSIRNGIRMSDRDYECSLLLCCGSPRLFGPDLASTQEGLNPAETHSHTGRERCRLGVELVCSARDSNANDLGFWYSLINVNDRGDLAWTMW